MIAKIKNQKLAWILTPQFENLEIVRIKFLIRLISQKKFLSAKFLFSEPSVTQKHLKSGCQQHGDELMIQIPKMH